MSRWSLVLSALVLAVVLTGCDSGSNPTPPASSGTTPTAAEKAAAEKQAQALIDQVNAAIKDKKWDQAEASLKKLEAMRGQLSGALQDQISALRKALDAAKTASGDIKLPNVNLPK